MRNISGRVMNALRKLAYVPLSAAAQDAMAGGMPPQGDPNAMPPMDPSMAGGMPVPPMDPSMGGAPMPPQGGQIQTVPGPNGEPIDPETGFVVIDPAQGIEQDPITGILFSKFTGEFATPDGQPMDPQQAQMMIEQAMSQQMGGGAPMPPPMDPSAVPPQDPAAMGGAPMDPSMGGMPPQGDPNAMPPMDPSMAGGMPPEEQAPAQPTIDDQTGLPIDPETGYYTTPNAAGDATGEMSAEMIPGLDQFMAKADKANDRQDKAIKRMTSEMVGTRTDIQRLTREVQQVNDNYDTAMARMEHLLALLESIVGRVNPPQQGGEQSMGEQYGE